MTYAHERAPWAGAAAGPYVDPRGHSFETWPGRAEGGRPGQEDRQRSRTDVRLVDTRHVLSGPGSPGGRKNHVGRGPADRTWYRRQMTYIAVTILLGAAILVA